MKKILLIKTSALGDIVHTYPVVSYLRRKFPSAQIDWVVEAPFSGLVTSHPDVNQALVVSTKKWRKEFFSRETWTSMATFRKRLQQENYDVAFDLQGNSKSGLITCLAKSQTKVGFSLQDVPEWPNVLFTNTRLTPPVKGNIREEYLSLVASYFGEGVPTVDSAVTLKMTEDQQATIEAIRKKGDVSKGPMIMVCPGSAWRNKQLTTATLKEFLWLVQNHTQGHFAFVWGSSDEKNAADELHETFPDHSQVVDKMSLPMLQNLMGMSDLVIAMDSLPLHLAGTTRTPTFSVFGASSAAKYKPLGNQHRLFKDLVHMDAPSRSVVPSCAPAQQAPASATCKLPTCLQAYGNCFPYFKKYAISSLFFFP